MPAWLICDRSFIRDYGLGLVHPGAGRRTIARYIADGYLHRADTLMELGERIGVDGKNLLRTVQEHNRYAVTGVDEAFGKGGTEYNQFNGDPANKPNPCLRPIAQPPFFAVAVYPSTMGTCVGLATDGDARVLDADGAADRGALRLRQRHGVAVPRRLCRARHHARAGARVRLSGGDAHRKQASSEWRSSE